MVRVGIRQVASFAGVSVGTVSNVLNGKTSVDPEIAARVNHAIEQLEFVPNDSARQLQSGQNTTIALVVLSSFNPFFNALAEFAEEAADGEGLSLVLASSAQNRDRETRYLSHFERQRVRGILLTPMGEVPEVARRIHKRRTPVILLGQKQPGFCSVTTDSEASGFEAVEHLMKRGRKKIAIVGGPASQIDDRLKGARRAIKANPECSLEFIETQDMTLEEGKRIGKEIALLPADTRPDGVFCANDLIAIGLVNQIIREENLKIPEDIAVVGHDDILFSSSAAVPLTTMRQPLREIAHLAVELLCREAAESTSHKHRNITIKNELVIRDSS